MESIGKTGYPEIAHLLDSPSIFLYTLVIMPTIQHFQTQSPYHHGLATALESNICLQNLSAIVPVPCSFIGRISGLLEPCRQLSAAHT